MFRQSLSLLTFCGLKHASFGLQKYMRLILIEIIVLSCSSRLQVCRFGVHSKILDCALP